MKEKKGTIIVSLFHVLELEKNEMKTDSFIVMLFMYYYLVSMRF